MIKIYCLVDPRNNLPFYVGATKIPLKSRLSGHIHEARVFRPNKYIQYYPLTYYKHILINEIISCGIRPRIDLLYISSLIAVEHYEQFFYTMLKNQGFKLFNLESQFNYLKYTKVDYYQFNQNT